MEKRRVLILGLAVFSVVWIFPTGRQDEASGEEKPPVVTMLMGNANQPAEKNSVLDEIYARTGIVFSPIVVPNEDYTTKLNAMIASKSVPHIIGFDLGDGEKFVQNNILLKLNELLDKYGPEILKNKAKYLHQGLNGSGDIWGIPKPGWYPNNLSVRTDWLESVGMKMPTDPDSFFAVLKAFTYNDPDRDGKNDTIGYGGTLQQQVCWGSVFAAFGVPYLRPIYRNGVVTSHINHPNYLDAIYYWRKLYQAGVMEPDFATIPTMQSFEKLWNGIYGVFDFTAAGTTNNWIGRYTEDPRPAFDFAIIRGPEGSGGCLQMYGTGYNGITVNCNIPEKAMELYNYLTTPEGNELLYFGIEGKHYRWIDKEAGTFEYITPYNDSATQRNDGGWIYFSCFSRHEDNTEFMTFNQITRRALKMGYENPIEDAFIFGVPEIQKELGTLLTDIEKECFATLVVTEGDVEAEYQRFVKRWLAEGGKTWEKQATEIYKKENNM